MRVGECEREKRKKKKARERERERLRLVDNNFLHSFNTFSF